MRNLLVFLALLLSASGAEAQIRAKLAASGVPVKLDFAYSTNPDCTAAGIPQIRVIGAPQNGRLEITQTADFPSFPANNVRNICNTRRVPGMIVRYISARGFVGTDYVVIEAIFPSGENHGQRRYSIQVK